MYSDMTAENISKIVPFQQPTIYRPSWTIFPVHLFQKKSILTLICSNFEGSFPDIFELTMLILFLVPCIPFQHHLFQLKFVCLCFSVLYFLNSLLQFERVLENFFSGLLQMDHLIYSPLHMIIFTANFLQKFDYWNCERGRKYHVNYIY